MKRSLFLIAITAVLAGCQTTTTTVKPDSSILRVGVSPRSQPMIYKQNDQIMGVEADFAKKMGKALNREVVFVEVPWEKQIDFLEQNKTDIIMSNMTITGARSFRVNFCTPYLQSGHSALFRRDSYDPSGLIGSTIKNQSGKVGFVQNTTGEFFCRQRFTRATLIAYDNADAAVKALSDKKIDMFVHDAPVVWWLSARHESSLIAFREVLNREPLAWAIAKHNMELMDEVNAQLKIWDEDGTSHRIIQNWITGRL